MLIAGCLGYKMAILIDIFYTLQLIHLFPVGRFYLPTGLFKFFKAFELLNFQGINFGIWDFDKASTKGLLTVNRNVVNYNFQKMGFATSSFIFTSIDVIISIMYMLFIPIVIRILSQVFRKSTWIRYLDTQIMANIIPFIINSTILILSFTAFLNLRDFNVQTEAESFGSITSYGYLVFIALFILIFMILLAIFWWNLRNTQKEEFNNDKEGNNFKNTTFIGNYLIYPFRMMHLYHYVYPLTQILRRILVGSIFAFWRNNGFLQLLFLSLLSGMNLVYHASYQPFEHKLRNIIIAVLEGAYLTICMTIFPYVYPNLQDNLFKEQAILVVRIFLLFFVIALFTPTIIAAIKLGKKVKKHPVFQGKVPEDGEGEGEDMRNMWSGYKNPKKEEVQEEKVIEGEPEAVTVKSKEDNTKKAVSDSESESSESEESSEETESITESESSNEDMEGDVDGYADTKRIPHADVNLDTQAGFSTGMSGMREAEIQKYRAQEKKLM